MTSRYSFTFDSSACSGCKACQVACKDKHQLEVGVLWRRVYEVSGGEWKQAGPAWIPDIKGYYLSVACNHCASPICVEVCPAQAITQREDGIVLISATRCIGCQYCSWACPYGALQFDHLSGTMTKCTFCVDRLDNGLVPECVSACPMRVLNYTRVDVQSSAQDEKHFHPLPDSSLTHPALQVIPHVDALRAGDTDLSITPGTPPLTHILPLALFTLLTQASVGMVAGLISIHLLPDFTWVSETLKTSVAGIATAFAFMGLLISLGHLGKPYRAIMAIRNTRNSWLSREIFCAAVFSGLILLYLLLSSGLFSQLFISSSALLTGLLLASGISGCVAMYSMARVYMLRTIPPWNTPKTIYIFFATSLLLGASIVVFILSLPGWEALIWGVVLISAIVFTTKERLRFYRNYSRVGI